MRVKNNAPSSFSRQTLHFGLCLHMDAFECEFPSGQISKNLQKVIDTQKEYRCFYCLFVIFNFVELMSAVVVEPVADICIGGTFEF